MFQLLVRAKDREAGGLSAPDEFDDPRCVSMKTALLSLLGAMAVLATGATPSLGGDRYADRPPVMVSPDLSAPWLLQLGHAPGIVRPSRQAAQQPQRYIQTQPGQQRTAAVQAPARRMVMRPQINPVYLPQEVAYGGHQKPASLKRTARRGATASAPASRGSSGPARTRSPTSGCGPTGVRRRQ